MKVMGIIAVALATLGLTVVILQLMDGQPRLSLPWAIACAGWAYALRLMSDKAMEEERAERRETPEKPNEYNKSKTDGYGNNKTRF